MSLSYIIGFLEIELHQLLQNKKEFDDKLNDLSREMKRKSFQHRMAPSNAGPIFCRKIKRGTLTKLQKSPKGAESKVDLTIII